MSKESNQSNGSANNKALVAEKEDLVWNISEANAVGSILQNFKELAMLICYEQWFKGDKTDLVMVHYRKLRLSFESNLLEKFSNLEFESSAIYLKFIWNFKI